MRADAERNRDAILASAREVFAERGTGAPLDEIAARAGVGIATLYRRFPTREQLVAAALTEQAASYADAAGQALADPDPWRGFVSFVARICEMQATDRGLSDLLSMALPAGEQVEELRNLANARVVELTDKAKSAGVLRPDFAGQDLLLMLIANAAVLKVTASDAPHAWQRFVALVLDAFQHREGQPLPPAPSADQMAASMLRLARERGCGRHP